MGQVLVVGAGVVGLTCAVRLLQAGHRVDVLARDLPLESTSAVAAALWYPCLALPYEDVTAWSRRSYEVFKSLADEESGVSLRAGTEVLGAPSEDPWWRSQVPDLVRRRVAGWADAWSFSALVIDMPIYLRWLVARVEALGGTVTRMNLSALPEPGHLVVNCSGIGARLLGADDTVHPVRGQVVHLEQWGLDEWWLHAAGPTSIVPRGSDVVVGGTDEQGEWSRTPSIQSADAILARAAELVPEIAEAKVLRHKVGLRPARPEVRVECVGDVVHCYGHGAAGVTLSWGCADAVVELAG